VLSELAQEGLIEVHGSEIQILDPVRIRGFLKTRPERSIRVASEHPSQTGSASTEPRSTR
jgi:hypothetical protein